MLNFHVCGSPVFVGTSMSMTCFPGCMPGRYFFGYRKSHDWKWSVYYERYLSRVVRWFFLS